jgi:hypothetical protein
MDREFVLGVLNNLSQYKVDEKDIKLLQEYSLEHGKPVEKLMVYIQVMRGIPNGIYNCLLDALDYYKKKFNIIELSKIDLRIPSGKQIIKYF